MRRNERGERMSNLIRQQDAIDALLEWYETPKNQDAVDVIRKVPVTQKWIPCSERLPDKEFTLYLVTYKVNAEDFRTGISDFYHGTWCVKPYREVVAWMPLPEPFEGVEE